MIHDYKNLIFTKHGAERLSDRTINADAVWQTITYPDKKFHQGTTTKFIKTVNGRLIHVVASYKQQENKWVVVSCWVRGEEDRVPLAWQLITLPFRVLGWLLKRLFSLLS